MCAAVLAASTLAGVARATTGARLTGVVTLNGHAVTGAVVTLTALPGLDAPVGPYRQEPVATVTTGADGRFALPLDVTRTILDLAAANGGYVNYAVQAHHNDATANPVVDAINDLATALDHKLPTVPTVADVQALVDALVEFVGPIKIGGDDPIPNVDPDFLVPLAENAIGLATDLVGQLPPVSPADVTGLVAELVAVLTELAEGLAEPAFNPYTAVFGTTGQAYSAADFVYSTVVGSGAITPGEGLVSTTLSTPDPVTLELIALGAGRGVVDAAGNPLPGTPDDDECNPRYAPYVTVEGRENALQPVGEAHVRYDSSASFDYGESANTDLNGAYSFGGSSWEVSVNANHMGNKQSLVRKPYAAFQSYELLTSFRYRKERLEFTDDNGDGRVCRVDRRIVPEGWVAGGALGADVSAYDSGGQMDAARGKGWATNFNGTWEYIKKTSRGKKYSAGVEAFGVGLYAQSTWSNQVDIHYTFGSDGDHWLYGSNGTITEAENVYAW